MAKITKFKQDVNFLFETAVSKYDKEDYVGCLDYLLQAQKKTEDTFSDDELSIRLEIADTYAAMGLFEESNNEYFLMSAFDYCLEEVFYALIKNFALMDMTVYAAHYLNLGIELGILDSDDGFMPIDIDEIMPRKKLRLIKAQDNEYVLTLAKQLIGSNETDFAREMLTSVSEESPQYLEAQNCLALLEMSYGSIEKGLLCCENVLSKNPQDLNALTSRLLGLSMSNSASEALKLKTALDELNISSWPEVSKVALCMAEIGDSELTAKYTSRAIKFKPYDRDMLLLNALANSNLGERAKAKDSIVKLTIIYPKDFVVLYYADAIDKAVDDKKFMLITELDFETRQKNINLIEESIKTTKNSLEFLNLMRKNSDVYNAVMWALGSNNLSLCCKVGAYIAERSEGYHIVRELLLNSQFPIIAKKSIFLQLLMSDKLYRIQILINNQLEWFHPNIPNVTKSKTLKAAYYKVYSTLAFIDNNFDRKLNIWYKKIVKALEANSNIKYKENAIAATLAYISKTNKIFSQKSYCCEVFDCEMKDLMLYLKEFESGASAMKIKSNAKEKK